MTGKFDRVIMPMPHTDEYFIATASPAVCFKGAMHMYFFDSEDAVNAFGNQLPNRIMNESGRSAKVENIQRYAPLL